MNSSGRTEQVFTGKKCRDDRETRSPERNKVWVEHKPRSSDRKVPVVYYLFRNGHLEQPHFMEVFVPSHQQGLSLRDVMNRLNFLRGKGMADMYSWASKRSYRNGFVWQDLSESDIIQPVFGHEHVLKGSELTGSCSSFRVYKPSPPPLALQDHTEPLQSGENCDSSPAVIVRRRNQSWSSFDRQGEYKVYKPVAAEGEVAGRSAAAADAATQTEDKRRRSPPSPDNTPIAVERASFGDPYRSSCAMRADLTRDEISPPPSSSSSTVASETVNSDGGGVDRSRGVDLGADIRDQTVVNDRPSGRMKASAVLLQLISCVSGPVKGGESTVGKDRRVWRDRCTVRDYTAIHGIEAPPTHPL